MAGSPGAGRQLLRDKRVYIALFLIGAWIVGSIIARPFYDRLGGDDDDGDDTEAPAGENFVELAPLVAASTRIVIATYEADVTGELHRRDYTIVEALRGTEEPGGVLQVWGDPGPGPEGQLTLEPGTDYLLFLVERELDGTRRWTAPGEPSAAAVGEDGSLTFIVSDRYAAEMLDLGWTTGTQRVPFNATLTDVRTSIGTP